MRLTTPSATRVYRTRGQPAVQETHIRIGEGASLEYLPDHVIPHRDSRFHQSLRVDMGRGSRAIFWDALAAGRVAHGERWNFTMKSIPASRFPCAGKPPFSTALEFALQLSIPIAWVSPRDSTTWRRLSFWRMNSAAGRRQSRRWTQNLGIFLTFTAARVPSRAPDALSSC